MQTLSILKTMGTVQTNFKLMNHVRLENTSVTAIRFTNKEKQKQKHTQKKLLPPRVTAYTKLTFIVFNVLSLLFCIPSF